MNSIEILLVELVAMAESPLYSAYRWLGNQLGRSVPLPRFLSLVNDLMDRDILRLWQVDDSYDRTELFEVPTQLAEAYLDIAPTTESFDPFGYILTLGPKAEVGSEPEWKIDINFEKRTFELLALNPHADLEEILIKLNDYFPDVSLLPTSSSNAKGQLRVVGRAVSEPS
jgi:hypothetical protein